MTSAAAGGRLTPLGRHSSCKRCQPGPRHCHARARVPVPGCSEVSQPGLPSCLVGCRQSSMKESMMRVFVAGATGAMGKQLVPRLVAAGGEVHGMEGSVSKQGMLHELGAVPAVADALDPDQVAEAVGRAMPDMIVHQLTAIGALDMRHFDRAFALTNRLRTEGTDHLLSAGQAVGVRRVVAQSYFGFFARTRAGGKSEEGPREPSPAPETPATLAGVPRPAGGGLQKAVRVPRLIGRPLAGEAGVVMMTDARGASNAKAKRELAWRPAHPTWRQGFAAP